MLGKQLAGVSYASWIFWLVTFTYSETLHYKGHYQFTNPFPSLSLSLRFDFKLPHEVQDLCFSVDMDFLVSCVGEESFEAVLSLNLIRLLKSSSCFLF